MSDQPSQSAQPTDDLVRRYLADRDVPCPACKYNLRGCIGAACPECGTPIVLSVAPRRQRWVPPFLAFLAFGWVLVAGILNTTRNAHQVYESAQVRSYFGSSVQIQGQVRIITSPGGTVTINGPGSYQTLVPGSSNRVGWFGLAWGNVPWDAWWPLAWSFILVVGGAAGVIVLVCHRRRPLSEPAWRAVRLHGAALFCIYGGYHLVMFVEEVMGW